MDMTRHAIERSVHRAIPMDVLSAINDYGTPSHSHGAIKLRLDRKALELAEDGLSVGLARKLQRYRGTYIVADGNIVITVARATRRLRK